MDCRIRVRGHLDPAWGDRLAGLRVAHEDGGVSLLAGPLPDQAALHGVLLRLFDLGLPLVSLDTTDPASGQGGRGNDDRAPPPRRDRGGGRPGGRGGPTADAPRHRR